MRTVFFAARRDCTLKPHFEAARRGCTLKLQAEAVFLSSNVRLL